MIDATTSADREAEDRDDSPEHVQQVPGEGAMQLAHSAHLQSHW